MQKVYGIKECLKMLSDKKGGGLMNERVFESRKDIIAGIKLGREIEESALTLRLPEHIIKRLSAEAELYSTNIDSTVLALIWIAWEMLDS